MANNLLKQERPGAAKLVLATLFCLSVLCANAQSKNEGNIKATQNNAITLEILGSSGGYYNLAYERFIPITQKTKFSVALGFQYLPGDNFIGPTYDVYSVTPQINFKYGKAGNYEFGMAFPFDCSKMIFHSDFRDPMRAIIFHMGYCFQPQDLGLIFKFTVNPTLRNDYFEDDLPKVVQVLMPGFTVGYCF